MTIGEQVAHLRTFERFPLLDQHARPHERQYGILTESAQVRSQGQVHPASARRRLPAKAKWTVAPEAIGYLLTMRERERQRQAAEGGHA